MGGCTKPSEHNPEMFRYLVHGFNPVAASTVPMLNAYVNLSYLKAGVKPTITPYVDLLTEPTKLRERHAISTSLIDKSHQGTWGDCGLILEIPNDSSVYTTSTSDSGSINYIQEEIEASASRQKIQSANQILSGSGSDIYNEVVIKGALAELTGFFIKVYIDTRKALNPGLAQKIILQAKSLNLPVVELDVEPKRKYFCQYNEHSDSYHLGYGEYTLIIPVSRTKKDSPLYCVDRDEIGFFPTLDFYETIVSNFKKDLHEITEKLSSIYKVKNKERQLPVIGFNEDGSIKFIRGQLGEGKDTTFEYYVSVSKQEYRPRMQNLQDMRSMNIISKSRANDQLPFEDIKKVVLSNTDKITENQFDEFADRVKINIADYNIKYGELKNLLQSSDTRIKNYYLKIDLDKLPPKS